MKKSEELVKFVDFALGIPYVRKYDPLCVDFEAFGFSGERLFDGALSMYLSDAWRYEYFLGDLDRNSEIVKEVRFRVSNPWDPERNAASCITFIKRW